MKSNNNNSNVPVSVVVQNANVQHKVAQVISDNHRRPANIARQILPEFKKGHHQININSPIKLVKMMRIIDQ